ncbi:Hypothetical protein, putative [Bodo saltans]|uniref:Uncharacterized protein n=1 Tax=Bodo saltans TaxID=75058 RepID=A0A0S4J0F3_BODSA|nr:Hypothetical protein, putative [Bodo saltans]|eukprot:CUG31561.1 Hypothetical protein, putative [Bodo saltans]
MTTSYQESFYAKKGDRILDYRDRRPPLNTPASPRHFLTIKEENAAIATSGPWERLTLYRPQEAVLEQQPFSGRTTQRDTFTAHYPYIAPKPHVQEPIAKLPGIFETTLDRSQRCIIDAMMEGSINRTLTARPIQNPLPNITFEASTSYKEQYRKPYHSRPAPCTPRSGFERHPETRDFITTKSASYLPPVSQRDSMNNSRAITPRAANY